jgi:hypothetical protein
MLGPNHANSVVNFCESMLSASDKFGLVTVSCRSLES